MFYLRDFLLIEVVRVIDFVYYLIVVITRILEVYHTLLTVTDRPEKGGRNELTGFEPVHESLRNTCGQGLPLALRGAKNQNTRTIDVEGGVII